MVAIEKHFRAGRIIFISGGVQEVWCFTQSNKMLLPKVRQFIWVRALNILDLESKRLHHNIPKVLPLQVFSKF